MLKILTHFYEGYENKGVLLIDILTSLFFFLNEEEVAVILLHCRY